jgi:hypothetical protein
MLDNREWAALIWLAAALLLILSRRRFRSGLGNVLRNAFPLVRLPLAAMLAYVALEVWIGYRLSLWNGHLLKGTIIWVLASGLAMFFNCLEKTSGQRFFRRSIVGAIGATAFVEFFMNLQVFGLPWELLIQPVLAILTLLPLVAARNEQHQAIKKEIDLLLEVIGFSLLGITVRTLYATWEKIDKPMLVLEFALPIWLTVLFLPCAYCFALYLNYDAAFRGINYAAPGWKGRLCAKLALVTKLHFKTRDIGAFAGMWSERIASAPDFVAARQVVNDFYKARREAAQAIINERERAQRYAGSQGVDEYDRRLDRREFKETTAALHFLSTRQMGWYGNHGGHYHADLLDSFRNDFTRQGLPAESGITMKVARDGQAWYAWRRTVSGWCFAIGANGPPPDQWEYDGPEPPHDVPGKDPCWGERPFLDDANPNWAI